MNITLVETNNPNWEFGVYTRNRGLDPISIGYIGAAAKQDGHRITLIQQREEDLEQLTEEILATKPDIVGYSCMTFTSDFALTLARKVKSRKKVVNVGGGYHFSAIAEPDVKTQLKDSCLDYVVLGEGEESFRELVSCLESKEDPRNVNGIAINEGGEFVLTGPRKRLTILDQLPWPIRIRKYLEGTFIKGVCAPTSEQVCAAQVSYSRGCVNSCSYCASPTLWGNTISTRSAQDTLNEIEYLIKEFGTNSLFFTDLTFNRSREKVFELCTEFKKRDLNVGWYAMCRPTPDEELFKDMKSAGCNKLAIGIEALRDTTLRDYHRRQTTQQTLETLRILDNLGISSRGYLIIGWPEEDCVGLNDFIDKNSKVLVQYAEAGLDMLRLSFLTPFPASTFYNTCKENDLFLTKDFSRFTSSEPILKSKLNPAELLEARQRLFQAFFESEEYSASIRSKFERFPQFRKPFTEYFAELKEVGINVKV